MAQSILCRVSRIDIQQYLSDGRILCGGIRVYPPFIPGRPFLLHGMFLYSSSLISVHTAFLSLSLLKLEALIGRLAGSSPLLKRNKMNWDIFAESQASTFYVELSCSTG